MVSNHRTEIEQQHSWRNHRTISSICEPWDWSHWHYLIPVYNSVIFWGDMFKFFSQWSLPNLFGWLKPLLPTHFHLHLTGFLLHLELDEDENKLPSLLSRLKVEVLATQMEVSLVFFARVPMPPVDQTMRSWSPVSQLSLLTWFVHVCVPTTVHMFSNCMPICSFTCAAEQHPQPSEPRGESSVTYRDAERGGS